MRKNRHPQYFFLEVSAHNDLPFNTYPESVVELAEFHGRPSRSSSLLCRRSTRDIVINHLFVMKLPEDGRTGLTDLFLDSSRVPIIVTSFASIKGSGARAPRRYSCLRSSSSVRIY
jgi:hypothetical protein